MDPELLLEQMNKLVEQGIPADFINQAISRATRDDIQSLEGLQEHLALQRHAARGNSAVGDFARMAAQGATLGHASKLAGAAAALPHLLRAPGQSAVAGGQWSDFQPTLDAFRKAKGESDQRVEDLRLLAPGASGAAESAGLLTNLYGALGGYRHLRNSVSAGGLLSKEALEPRPEGLLTRR